MFFIGRHEKGSRNSFLVKTRCSFVNSSRKDLRAWITIRINVPSF